MSLRTGRTARARAATDAEVEAELQRLVALGAGTPDVAERLEIARAKGRGQQEFAFLNPMTKQIEPKLMFFERMDDIVVACGSYKPV